MTQLPPQWIRARLEDLCTVTMGQSPPSSTYNEAGEGLPFFQGKAEFGDLYPVPSKWCTAPTKIAAPGDILLSVRAPVGPTNIAQTTSAIGRGLAALSPRANIDQKYILYAIRNGQQKLASMGTGTTFAAVSGDVVRNFLVPVPPSREQNRIADKLDELLSDLDAGVAALERTRINLKRYRAEVLKQVVDGRLTEKWRVEHPDVEPASTLLDRISSERRKRWEEAQFKKYADKGESPPKGWKERYSEPVAPDVSKLPKLPKGWCWTTVGAVGDVLLGRQRAPQYLTGRYSKKYLRVANIKDDRIDFGDLEEMDFDPVHFKKYRLMPGDILVSEGQSPELLGQSAIFNGEVPDLCFQKTLHRFRAAYKGVSTKYAQVVFRAHVVNGVFRRLGSITTNIAHLTLEKFCAAPFPLPPVEEQAEIVRKVEMASTSIAHVSDQLKQEKVRSANLRQAILKRAFEGRLVAQDPADEPASELLKRISAQRERLTDARRKKSGRRKESAQVG